MDVKQWITVHPNGADTKGQPIPVMEGQSKGEAVKAFIDKHSKHKDKSIEQLKKEQAIEIKPYKDIKTTAPDSQKEKLYDIVSCLTGNEKKEYVKNGEADYEKYYQRHKGLFKESYDGKSGNAVFDFIVNPQAKRVRIQDEHPEFVKPYHLKEVWLYPSRYGSGYYFSVDVNGKREYITVDSRTANSKHWSDDYTSHGYHGNQSFKVSANGYVYVDKNGKARYSVQDLNNFELIQTYKKYD